MSEEVDRIRDAWNALDKTDLIEQDTETYYDVFRAGWDAGRFDALRPAGRPEALKPTQRRQYGL